jgi:hypothetical protein
MPQRERLLKARSGRYRNCRPVKDTTDASLEGIDGASRFAVQSGTRWNELVRANCISFYDCGYFFPK